MTIWDLDEHGTKQAESYAKQKGYDKITHPKFRVGDVIKFYTGYNDDIHAKAKIKGFDNGGGIYVYNDCFWYPIKDNSVYKIQKAEA